MKSKFKAPFHFDFHGRTDYEEMNSMDRPGLLQYTAEYSFSQLKCKLAQTSNLKKLLIFLENDYKRYFVDEFEYLALLDLRPNLARLLFPCFLIVYKLQTCFDTHKVCLYGLL